MKKIIFILTILIVSSCGLQRKTFCERKAQKVARILKDCPNIIDTTSRVDTVIIRDSFSVVITAPIDSQGIDSLLLLYCDALSSKDTTKSGSKDSTVIYRERLIRQYIFKECEKINDGSYFLKDQNGDSVEVVLKGRTIKVFQNKKVITVTNTLKVPCPDRNKIGIKDLFYDWWIFLFGVLILGLGCGIYFKGK